MHPLNPENVIGDFDPEQFNAIGDREEKILSELNNRISLLDDWKKDVKCARLVNSLREKEKIRIRKSSRKDWQENNPLDYQKELQAISIIRANKQ